jgi:hypothetical protein
VEGAERVFEGRSVVIAGRFNPAIFQPAWFPSVNLLRPKAAERARIELLTEDVAAFQAGWLSLQATQEQFVAATTDPLSYELLRDLVVGVFTVLSHSPTSALGLNHDFHYRVPSEAEWHALGHRLAPKEPWADTLNQPGMRSLTMQGVRRDSNRGSIFVKVEPSLKMDPGQVGLFVGINDHYTLSKKDDFEMTTDTLIDLINRDWDESSVQAETIIAAVLDSV